jgi:hypothetical protein
MARNTDDAPHRAQRILGVMAFTVVGLSVVAIAALLIANALGVATGAGLWAVVAVLPLVGLPLAILLMIAFILVSAVTRSRQARADR